jgi:cyclopropane-fatty-acyl-phospholipid synthase
VLSSGRVRIAACVVDTRQARPPRIPAMREGADPSEDLPPSGASQAAIASHYDVGNDFFRLWLDDTMTYSCALWDGTDDLEKAQEQKLDYFLDHVATKDGSLLDVGCGFGGLLRRARDEREVACPTGLTLSTGQYEEVSLVPGVQVRLESWQDHQPDSPYDGIVSIGAIEHFARPDLSREGRLRVYGSFFERLHEWTVPGAPIGIQSIVNERAQPDADDQRPVTRFFYDEVFPESSLPRLAELIESADPYFEVQSVRTDADHYAQTCRAWRSRLRRRRAEADAIVGVQETDWYLRYLMMSEMTFSARWCGLVRVLWRRRNEPVANLDCRD